MTTLTQFVTALGNVSVTGVKRAYTAPPRQVYTADCPAQYPRLPRLENGPVVACGDGLWPTLTGEIVICVEPVLQGEQPTNFALVLTLMDALNTALQGATLAKSKHTWTLSQEWIDFGDGTTYWAIIATIAARG